jgi:PilZ domain-containing protein
LGFTVNPTNDAIADEVQYAPDCSPEQIEEVLSSLDRWSERTAKHVVHRRRAKRHQYHTNVTVELYDGQDADATPRQTFTVTTRNLSKTGLGLVIPPVLVPRLLSDATPLVRSEAVFQVGMKIRVTLGPPTGIMPTLWAEIVRVRPVHFGFFEIGVRFLDREPE